MISEYAVGQEIASGLGGRQAQQLEVVVLHLKSSSRRATFPITFPRFGTIALFAFISVRAVIRKTL
jgi:hypothetical protein